ncbi:2400_t:CDS:2 [Ambispora leptoticha]|uniref:2400_t:CDS:1 n=1 Tax=Ambispora leptoticha TaxID=144679 RepID=A0A9N9CPV6_9GLOM|nr:2400_t:CDS:2 [Ambispora leptoticha]
MTDIRNIILIGRTENGKSTLANVLINSNEFMESAGSISETRKIQIKEFEETIDTSGDQVIKYRVIDTVGLGDTGLIEKEVLYKVTEASHYIREGLNQILFVTNGRFTLILLGYLNLSFLTKGLPNTPPSIIHVNNSSLKGRSAATNRDIREESRKRLLIYLTTCQGIYKPENLDAMMIELVVI